MHASQRVLPSGLASIHAPSTPTQAILGKQSSLSSLIDLLLYNERIVIPQALRLGIRDCIHRGHLGISKCIARARMSVWWPGLSVAIEDMVKACFTCARELPIPKEPLMPSSFPSRPWEKVSTDLFDAGGRTYLITVDYYSRWFEIKLLPTQTAKSVIKAAKELFATHVPDIVISDNGPCFSAVPFQEFAAKYGFFHTTSSPRYPRADGEVERAVRTVKGLLKRERRSLPCTPHLQIYALADWSLAKRGHGKKTAYSAPCPCKDIDTQKLEEGG